MPNIPIHRRRDMLLDAGARVIARSGVASATTRAIVAEAGMPLASFHYAFTNHQEFLLRLIERELVPAPVPRLTADDFPTALGEFVGGLISQDADTEGGLAELAVHGMQHAALRDEIAQRIRAYDDQLITALEQLAATHGMEWTVPPERLARLVNSWRFGTVIESSYARRGSPYADGDPGRGLTALLACAARPVE